MRRVFLRRLAGVLSLLALPAFAADYPAPKEADWVAKDFKFHSGEVMPALRLHYTTIGPQVQGVPPRARAALAR